MDTKTNGFGDIWKDGQIVEDAPKWATYRKIQVKEFPSPFRGSADPLADSIAKAVKKMDQLKPDATTGGPVFLGTDPTLHYTYPEVKNVKMPEKGEQLDQVIDEVVNLFQGAPNWGNPLTMCNIIPQCNTAGIVASMVSQIFAPNILEGEYSYNVHKAELETAGMIANLIGWEPTKAGAIYTWGGGGCWTYAVKYGLTRVLPDSRYKGIRTDAKILCSEQAHYAQQNASDWMGIGMDNVIRIKTDPETNQMDVKDLAYVMKDLTSRGIPVATVVCTMGTTDACAFDPVAKVREVMDQYPNPKGFGKAILYCDCVVGWSWITFKHYDFEKNPLGFSAKVLPVLKRNAEMYKEIYFADAIGVDFHKLGFAPYVSSCFVYQNAKEFEDLHRRGEDAYLQVRTPYNPMYYTCEVSRTSSGSLAGWATLKYFGVEGFQAIIGGIEEVKYHLYDLIQRRDDMVVANPDDTGFITLFRPYPAGVDARKQFEEELNDPNKRSELIKHNRIIHAIGDKLYEWYREGKQINGKYTPYMSFSTGFRTTNYNRDEHDPEAVIYAIKSFPMNVFVTPEVMDHMLVCVEAARDEVIKEFNQI
ncbi:MAG TPA: aspartate aminotransferase family protein [Porphyromonadaceae bacterium]|nr:aspartate aminotransferase family protein [Porphyromonadaceae bacterium]